MNRLVFTGRGGGPSIGCGTGTISGFCGVCEPDQAGTRTGFETTEARLTGYRAGDAVGWPRTGRKVLSIVDDGRLLRRDRARNALCADAHGFSLHAGVC